MLVSDVADFADEVNADQPGGASPYREKGFTAF
jgi:hypothetical protein